MTKNSAATRRGALTLRAALMVTLLSAALAPGCLPESPVGKKGGERTITLYGFSVMKESLEKAVFPGFAAKWKREHGQDVKFTSSFAGSETITNQILQGVGADVGIFSIERDVDRLQQAGFVAADWRERLPHRGIMNKTPFVILVRKGNPKGIRDFPDLGKPGVKLIHPDPVSSGGAMWSVLAIYGAELKKTEAAGARDEAQALRVLKSVWANVIATPGSAREARTQFETGYSDALVTYELEGLLMKQANADIEIVVPQSTIFSEHPAVPISRNLTPEERPLVEAFMQYLWSEEAQRAFVQYHFRSSTDEALDGANAGFVKIATPFTVEYFGGWSRAYPDIIERVWRDQVQKKK